MLVQFAMDFRGKVTQEMFYPAGTVADFDAATAEVLIAEGRAIAFHPAQPAAPEPAPIKTGKASRPTGGGVL